jgi:polysaccharide deacetylase 2 family uncharacterized protein YibQ
MMHLWCWLFATCVAAMPPPAATRLAQREPIAVPAAAPEAARTGTPGVRVSLDPPPPPKVASLDELVLGALFNDPPDGVAAEGLVDLASPAGLLPIEAPPAGATGLAGPRLASRPGPAPTEAPAPSRAMAAAVRPGRPTISLVIDGMGLVAAQSARAIALPGPLALSWLPHAAHLAEQVAAGAAHGHESLLHMPMETLGRAESGAGSLRTWLPPASNLATLRAALQLVPDAIGLTGDEASVASLSVPLMDLVMQELHQRGMAFLDNGTLPHEVALDRAAAAGLAAAGRDLLIDADPDPDAIRSRLAEAEAIARRQGHAILIAHPRPTTLQVLEQYLPTLGDRGLVLWPVSAALAAERPVAAAGGAAPPPAAAAAAALNSRLISSGPE